VRLSEPAAPELVHSAYARELADIKLLYEGISCADLAHILGLLDADVIPAEAGGQLLSALLAMHPEPPLDFVRDPASGDVYSNREAYLSMLTPHGGFLAAGRARREATTIGFRLAVRGRLLRLAAALIRCARSTLEATETHSATLFPDYTYLQTAQPTTFGHYLLTFAYPVLRDLERLRAAYGRTNVSPAGCGSVNGSRLSLERERLAERLGFEAVITHPRDAMWQADGPIEIAALLSSALINLDRLAEDLQVFATQEFALVELADRHSRSSKIMPQKKNPYSLAYVRGVAGESLGTLTAMAALGKTPSGQPDNRIFAHGDLPRALEQATGAVKLMRGILRGLTVNKERAAERAAASFSGATDLAEVLLLEYDLDYHTAHQVVARAVREALEGGAATLTSEVLADAAEVTADRRIELPAERLEGILDPAAIVATRDGVGGAAAGSIAAMLRECGQSLEGHDNWCKGQQRRLANAEEKLLSEARAAASKEKKPTESKSGKTKIEELLAELPQHPQRRQWPPPHPDL
jgi:argininosuccinate lyase